MSGKQKRRTQGEGEISAKRSRRQVSKETFNKWKKLYELKYQTATWLRCTTDSQDKSLVSTLWCETCRKYEKRIDSLKNFSRAWIDGSTNHKTSNIMDHASSDQHKMAMMRLCEDRAKNSGEPIMSYSTIARSIILPSLDPAAKERIRKKIDISYFLAKENLPFTKFVAVHDLQERHGVDLGFSYKTRDYSNVFLHYIAESQRQGFHQSLSDTKFYSILMDASTDKGKIENELFAILYCQRDDATEEIRSCARYFSVVEPSKCNADGLVKCLGTALELMGIKDVSNEEEVLGVEGHPILVGCGTDGATVNISEQNGMRGKLQKKLPWLFWAWCFAHRLELACKDALKSNVFCTLTEMMLRLYYLYEKSPKRCRELSDIIEDFREIFEFPEGGNLPIRAQGSRWISFKRKALQRIINRYGAYINHLSALAEDKTVKTVDRQRLKGYVTKWRDGQVLLGCALYVDILQAPSFLSLTLQNDSLDIVQGIQHILKSHQSLKKLVSQDPLQWPTVKLVSKKILEKDGKKTYQGMELKRYTDVTIKACKEHAIADLNRLDKKMRDRLEWSNIDLLRAILIFLDTQNWQCHETETDDNLSEDDASLAEIKTAVSAITEFFRAPLEAKGVELCSIQDEIDDAVIFARKYLNIKKDGYKRIWYRLHTAPDVASWPNLLVICHLLFSLPFSTGKVERLFSSLKVIKNERRTRLSVSTLNDLMEVKTEGPSLTNFSPDAALDLWWKDCSTTRRVQQKPRKQYKKRNMGKGTETQFVDDDDDDTGNDIDNEAEEYQDELTLEVWDDWFDDEVMIDHEIDDEQ